MDILTYISSIAMMFAPFITLGIFIIGLASFLHTQKRTRKDSEIRLMLDLHEKINTSEQQVEELERKIKEVSLTTNNSEKNLLHLELKYAVTFFIDTL